MKRVIIESPFAGDRGRNIRYARLATAERVISEARGNRCRCCGSTFMRLRAENEKRVDTIAELRKSEAALRERLWVAEERIARAEALAVELHTDGRHDVANYVQDAISAIPPASDAAPKETT